LKPIPEAAPMLLAPASAEGAANAATLLSGAGPMAAIGPENAFWTPPYPPSRGLGQPVTVVV
jgi:hypothetical protein